MKFSELVPAPFLVILGSMGLGYLVQRLRLMDSKKARPIMVWIQKNLTPWIIFASFWGLPLKSWGSLALPFLGLLAILFQLSAASALAPLLGLKQEQKGSFLIGAVLSNIGYLGWMVNLALFGQKGYDYAFLYGFYFTFAVYFLAYPLAARYTSDERLKRMSFLARLSYEGILAIVIAAIVVGFC